MHVCVNVYVTAYVNVHVKCACVCVNVYVYAYVNVYVNVYANSTNGTLRLKLRWTGQRKNQVARMGLNRLDLNTHIDLTNMELNTFEHCIQQRTQ